MWYCESGCVEQRPAEMIFDTSDLEMFRQSQGIPTKWFCGNHTVLCSACQNLFEVWIKDQPIYEEYAKANIRGARLKAELEAGIRQTQEVESEIIEHELTVERPMFKRAFAIVQTWFEARKLEVTTQVKAAQAERKAKRDAERERIKAEKGEKK